MQPNPTVEALEERLAKARSENSRAMDDFGCLLSEVTSSSVTKAQFDLFRRNYLYRSITTVYTVAATVAAQLRHEPPDIPGALRTVYGALLEEIGAADSPSRVVTWIAKETASHVDLLFACLNEVTRRCYPGLPSLTLADAADSTAVLPHAVRYRARQQALFDSADYASTLGAAYGQECAAKKMLETIKAGLFDPLRMQFAVSSDDWARAMVYFDVHLSGEHGDAEENHAEEALLNLKPTLARSSMGERACLAAEESFALQSEFFLNLARAMKTA